MIPLICGILVWGLTVLWMWVRVQRLEAEYELLKRALTKAGIDPYGK